MTAGRRWLVELDLPEAAGRPAQTLRWATAEVDVPTLEGEILRFESGLLAPLRVALEDQIVIEVLDPSIDWPRRYREVLGARSRLLLWEPGTTLEEATTFGDGTALLPSYGSRNEPVSWEILPDDMADGGSGALVPRPNHKISDATWPIANPVGSQAIPEDSRGVCYPELFGYPGMTGPDTARPVMPAYFGQQTSTQPTNSHVIIAVGAIEASEVLVRLEDPEDDDEAWEPVGQVEDLLGTVVSTATFDYGDPVFPSNGVPCLVGFRPSTGGGLYRSAYDVVVYMLRKYGSKTAIDWQRIPEVRDLIGPYQVDTWIDEPIPVWDWIEYLIEHLPIEIGTSRRGRFFLPKVYRRTVRQVVDRLVVGEGVERQGQVEVGDSAGVQNEYVIDYAEGPDGFTERVILTGRADDDARTVASLTCRQSQDRYGVRPGDGVVELGWTYDRSTAVLVGEWMADQAALPERRLQLRLEGRWERQEGDVVSLLDEELGIDGLATIDEPPVVDELGVSVTLRIDDAA